MLTFFACSVDFIWISQWLPNHVAEVFWDCCMFFLWMFIKFQFLIGFDGGMDHLLIPFLGGWTSIYQLFWCSPGVQGFDTLPWNLHGFCVFWSTDMGWFRGRGQVSGPVVLPGTDHFRMLPLLGRTQRSGGRVSSREDRLLDLSMTLW